MPPSLWKRLDVVESPPVYLGEEDICVYARDYVARGGWAASVANNLMNNFKKEPSKRGTIEWEYKIQAVNQLADELSGILPQGAIICTIPTSQPRGSEEYDPRFDMLVERLKTLRPDIKIEEPITCRQGGTPAHHGGTRTPSILKGNFEWSGFAGSAPETIFQIDDVLTTGGHFRACKEMIAEHCPDTKVVGLFFCKTARD